MADTKPPPRVRITSMRIVARALDGNALSGMVGFFDCVIPSFAMFGCELHRRRNGTLCASPPRGQRGDGFSSGLRIEDDVLRAELTEAACKAAAALGANVTVTPPLPVD